MAPRLKLPSFVFPPARTTSFIPRHRSVEGGNKSIPALLLAINCALKFYSVFMICRQLMIYVDALSHPPLIAVVFSSFMTPA